VARGYDTQPNDLITTTLSLKGNIQHDTKQNCTAIKLNVLLNAIMLSGVAPAPQHNIK
jgi:hypothetical protein